MMNVSVWRRIVVWEKPTDPTVDADQCVDATDLSGKTPTLIFWTCDSNTTYEQVVTYAAALFLLHIKGT